MCPAHCCPRIARQQEWQARQEEWRARQEQREQDPEWQRRHDAYLRRQAKRDAEAKAEADRKAAEAKAQADQRLKAKREAHQQLLAKLEADRQKAQQEAKAPAADEQKAQADLDDWTAPKAGPHLKSWTEEDSDDASTVATETNQVLERRERHRAPEKREHHRGPFLYFNNDEAQRLQKVKAALAELDWLQKQVDAGKKCELDRSQFAKIHGKHAEKRLKELKESEVLKMERAGYKLREKYY